MQKAMQKLDAKNTGRLAHTSINVVSNISVPYATAASYMYIVYFSH